MYRCCFYIFSLLCIGPNLAEENTTANPTSTGNHSDNGGDEHQPSALIPGTHLNDAEVKTIYKECGVEDGVQMICEAKIECPNPKANMKGGVWELQKCGTMGAHEFADDMVCCIPNSSSKGLKSIEKCTEYAASVYAEDIDSVTGDVIQTDTCVATEPLIVGGKNAEPKEYPHMGLVGVEVNGTRVLWICGCSLISDQFVLSAAHCTVFEGQKVKYIRLGEWNRFSLEDNNDGLAQPIDYQIIDWYNHPGYDGFRKYNDIALYKISTPVDFSEYIRPICINSNGYTHKTYAIATGWGLNDKNEESAILQKVNLTFASTERCDTTFPKYRNPKRYFGIRSTSMLCTEDLPTGKDACKGDSGGPLQVRLEEPHCMYLQLGVINSGPLPCGREIPGILSNVSHFLPWIEKTVWP